MSDKIPAPVVLASHDQRFRVEFVWKVDRFQHQILLDETTLISSLEGNASDTWPCSPPLQQLSLEQINGRPVVLGVGSAGTGHWSVSVEMDAESGSIKFDFACRCSDEPAFLGSTYHLLSDRVTLEPDGETQLEPDGETQLQSALGNDSLASPESSDRVQSLVAKTTPGQSGTICWSYRAKAKQPR